MSALPSTYDLYHRTAVQKALNEKTSVNPPLEIDGDFGPASIAALRIYQAQNDLPQSGVYDAATQALLEPFIAQKYVLYPAFQSGAQVLSVATATLQAIAATESSGSGFFPDGTCEIRFERHIMLAQLAAAKGQLTANALVNRFPSVVNPVPGGYSANPYDQLNLALTIDQTCALASTSWGMFQIMGFNFASCGYDTVQAYVADMKTSETLQLNAIVNFCKVTDGGQLLTALQAESWDDVARIYNGPDAVASYSAQLQRNYSEFAG
jgi:peptidoglycan hydrolase-like protein with peptidoglycan-binding domain